MRKGLKVFSVSQHHKKYECRTIVLTQILYGFRGRMCQQKCSLSYTIVSNKFARNLFSWTPPYFCSADLHCETMRIYTAVLSEMTNPFFAQIVQIIRFCCNNSSLINGASINTRKRKRFSVFLTVKSKVFPTTIFHWKNLRFCSLSLSELFAYFHVYTHT